ncbi:MAG TPA: hypothetical protein VM221_14500 [Armatimonadota bacterium]|nr:hypothetical protein [Armatimonadota bacterium]
MSRFETGKGSTFRFVCGIALVVVAALAVAYWLFVASLKATLEQRLAQLRAKGIPTAWAQVIPPPVPDHDNAAILYQQAFDQRPAWRTDGTDTLRKFLKDDPPGTRRKLAAGMQEILARNQAALDLVRAAADKPRCRFPVWNDAANPCEILYRHFASMRQCAQLLGAEALIRSARGDTAGALASCRTSLRMADHADVEPTLIAFLVSSAISSITFSALKQVIEEGELDPRTCRDLSQQLGDSDAKGRFRKALQGEFASRLWLFEEADRNPEEFVAIVGPDEPLAAASVRLCAGPLGRPLRLLDEIAYLGLSREALSLAEKPYRESEPGYRELDKKLEDLPSYCLITQMVFGIYARAAVARDRALATRDAMRVALALEAYHGKYHRYPDALDALRAYPGWELPEDPFSGKDFGYKRQGEGFVLYSWGEDLDDDGGQPVPPRYGGYPPDGDTVWTFAR